MENTKRISFSASWSHSCKFSLGLWRKNNQKKNHQKEKEEAILDFFIVCKKIAEFINKLIFDEEKEFPLSRYTKAGVKHSDHNIMILNLDIEYHLKKPDRKELFNFKNIECQKAFFQKTENSTLLTECFYGKKCSESQAKDWFSKLIFMNVSEKFAAKPFIQVKIQVLNF